MSDYLHLNQANWDERAPLHAVSKDYAAQRFVDSPDYISDVVRFDLPLLGDIKGLRTVHLQCHIGTDTLSLARKGADVIGLDFSPASLEQARELSKRAGATIQFVESDVYKASQALPKNSFDLVYTGIGALCWLPDIDTWARNVSELLKPGGRLFIREGHPMLWSIDETNEATLLCIELPYFERKEPLVWDDANTYVETEVDKPLKASVTHQWNHGLGEIITALLAHGLDITGLVEHQSVPWPAIPAQMTFSQDDGEWRLNEKPWRLPLSYTLQAVKRLS
ncbi:class I SAM-dependent methyltransferase [Pseudomonas yamanorum]|nr:class I SAM-dependent methyltransferase [Pseudomonas yamanorum]